MLEQTTPNPSETQTPAVPPTPPRYTQQDDTRFKGRKVKLQDLPEEQGGLNVDAQDLANLYEKMLMEFREGEIVKGKIIAIGTKENLH